MSIREKFFNAVRRKDDRYIPFEFYLCPSLYEEFVRRTGEKSYEEYFDFPVIGREAACTTKPDKFFKYFTNPRDISITSDWGVGSRKGSIAHFTEMIHPMKNFTRLEEFEEYPYPDPTRDYKWDDLTKVVNEIKAKDKVAVAELEMTIFEIAWYLRGMDVFMMDMVLNPDLANYHLDRITSIKSEMAKMYAMAGFDMLKLGDDVSTQLDMMMNPDTWREFLKPRLAKVIKGAKDVNPDILIFYHGDGNLQKIIHDLIEIGVEILNPVQPECMDPIEIKKKYGDRLSFWGTLGTQSTMPFGTSDEVRRYCQKMIEEVGKGGGLILAPTHVLEPEVPWENIQAFIDTVNEHNKKGEVHIDGAVDIPQ